MCLQSAALPRLNHGHGGRRRRPAAPARLFLFCRRVQRGNSARVKSALKRSRERVQEVFKAAVRDASDYSGCLVTTAQSPHRPSQGITPCAGNQCLNVSSTTHFLHIIVLHILFIFI